MNNTRPEFENMSEPWMATYLNRLSEQMITALTELLHQVLTRPIKLYFEFYEHGMANRACNFSIVAFER